MADLKTMFAKMANGGASSNGSGDQAEPVAPPAPPPKPKKNTTVEQIYQKKSQLEHILLRPDTYIGSVEKVTELRWVFDDEKKMMVPRKIEYVPGLYKIFDEILVNAADNKQRDTTMDCIKIEIKPEENLISVWNNGQGIPVVIHKEEKMYVPTMIFGHLLTSSNYNDEEEKVTGGRNGFGAKLCNIFSDRFIVETASSKSKQQFKQTWGSNMSKASEPKIKDYLKGSDFTKITFQPDLKKFKMDKLDEGIVAIMHKRAYDIAASTRGVKVFLNGQRLPIKNFKDYVNLYLKEKTDLAGNNLKAVYEAPNARWEVAVTASDFGFQQVSFVNSIATTKGGRHVDYIVDMLVKQLQTTLKKKNKDGSDIKTHQVKAHMWVFVNCLIVNPTFDSQTKENMTLQVKKFGSKCELSKKFFMSLLKSDLVDRILSSAVKRIEQVLVKSTKGNRNKVNVEKLEDANKAGTKMGWQCTLFLTEGDSAKSLVVSGFGVIGRDKYGVYPLRGKLLNVREATSKQFSENNEILNLIKILGLKHLKKYETIEDLKTLRYGKVMIMTDQDQDGSHIKGLLINLFHYKWPGLLRLNFLEEFITPIVKVKKNKQTLSFYSLPEFEEWKKDTPNHHTFQIKYYKGLGTSTSQEAKEYFSNMDRHRIPFRYGGQEDDDHIVLAFSKKHIEARKEWLTNFMQDSKRRKEMGLPEKYLYTKETKYVSYKDFINLELVLFSNADNIRSIPCLVDGFKPGQRKILFTCFKRNDKREVKVAQLAGSVAEHSAYHHGEVSLCATIVNLAQNYVGSNNINLLEPRGQFGTRLSGGKDSASPRYIFTKLSPMTRMIFHPHDDALLKHEYDDNQKIEPVWYVPIIPMVLVNGADGIGTGWMTKIPNYNPRDLVKCLRAMLNNEEPKVLNPWYKNFKGTIELYGEGRYCVSGEIAILGNELEITELPIGTWTGNYKEHVLQPLVGDKVKDFKDYNTDTTVRFLVTPRDDQLEAMEAEGLHKVFKLQSVINTSSMCCFDEMGCLKRYDSVMEILKEFYVLRLKMYEKRKYYLEGVMEAEAKKLSNQARFILEKCNGTLTVENKKRKTIVEELIKKGYDPDPLKEWKKRNEEEEEENEDEEEEQSQETESSSSKKKPTGETPVEVKKFDYLLGMSMWMLTDERKNELLRQRDNKLAELDVLKRKTPADIWREDLDAFLEKLDSVEENERKEASAVIKVETETGRKNPVEETKPSASSVRIKPVVSEDLKRKLQTALKSKENKVKRTIKKELTEEAEDEFDMMVKDKRTLKDKLGTPDDVEKKVIKKKAANSDGMKQTKLTFEKKVKREAGATNDKPKRKTKKKNYDSDDDASKHSDESFEANVVTSPVKERTNVRRMATKVTKYTLSDDESMSDNDELFDNELVTEPNDKPATISDDSEDEKPPPRLQESSEDLFDSLVGAWTKDESKEEDSSAASKRKLSDSESGNDSEAEFVPKKTTKAKPKKPRAKKKKMLSDSDCDDDDDEDFTL